MHIGLIGGIGPAATQFYYRHICRLHDAAKQTMELTIVHADRFAMAERMMAGDAEAQAAVYVDITNRLKAAGAEAVAITSIGGHFAAEAFLPIAPLPVLHIVPAIVADLKRRGIQRIGLIGTKAAMTSGLYGGLAAAGIDPVAPEGADLDAAHDAYVGLAMAAAVTEAQRATLFRIGETLVKKQGADAVLLAGTDLFLAFEGQDTNFPVIDGALVHAEALYRASAGGLGAYPGA